MTLEHDRVDHELLEAMQVANSIANRKHFPPAAQTVWLIAVRIIANFGPLIFPGRPVSNEKAAKLFVLLPKICSHIFAHLALTAFPNL